MSCCFLSIYFLDSVPLFTVKRAKQGGGGTEKHPKTPKRVNGCRCTNRNWLPSPAGEQAL